MEQTATICHRGETRTVSAADWQATVDEMVARLGAWEPNRSSVRMNVAPAGNSTFSKQVHDDDAQQRIEQQHEMLRERGVNVDANRQLFATGTRMANIGYATQEQRKREHENMRPLAEVTAALADTVRAERRVNRVVTAGDFATKLSINGKLTFDGYELREQALRGLLLRLESPAAAYVFGVRDRMREEKSVDARLLDKGIILDTLQRECRRNPRVKLNLRMRDALHDIFAVVSPAYGEADAPAVLPAVTDALTSYQGVRGTSSYDPGTTAWEVRAQVHTPTPTQRQAVGEPFRGYVSVRSRDNGTGRLSGGGGVLLIACLNATVYVAGQNSVSRVHRGRIMVNLSSMVGQAVRNIDALCEAWGMARLDVIELPTDEQGKLIPIEQAISGFYRHMLTERRGELVGVLPGRTNTHADALQAVYFDQRRNCDAVTRADLAQGVTRYIQHMPLPVQQDAEVAVAGWLRSERAVQYVS